MEDKYWWAVGSAVLGWLGAQFTAVLRDYVFRYRLKRAIQDEIRQIYDETERVWWAYARSVQMFGAGIIEGSVPLPLSNYIFANHYKDAALAFTRVQRTAVQMTYNYVAQLNSMAEELDELQRRSVRGELDRDSVDAYGRRLRSALHTVGIVRWHLWYYQTNPLFPIFEFKTEKHAEFAKFVDYIESEVERIEQSGKGMSPDDFATNYDPKIFAPEPASGAGQ